MQENKKVSLLMESHLKHNDKDDYAKDVCKDQRIYTSPRGSPPKTVDVYKVGIIVAVTIKIYDLLRSEVMCGLQMLSPLRDALKSKWWT